MAKKNSRGFNQGLFRAALATVAAAELFAGCTVNSVTNNEKGAAGAESVGGSGGKGGVTAGTASNAVAGSAVVTPVGNAGTAGSTAAIAAAGQVAAVAGSSSAVVATAGNNSLPAGAAGSSAVGAAGAPSAPNAGAAGTLAVKPLGGAGGFIVLPIAGAPNPVGVAGNAAIVGQAGAPSIGSNPCTAADPGNDTRETPTPHALGSTYSACLQTGTDVDYYEFTVPAAPASGGVVQVALTDVTSTGNVESFAYSAADNGTIESNYASNGTNVYYWFGVTAGSKYRISVAHWNGTVTTAYTLKTTFTPVNDTYAPNDQRTSAKTITVGTPASAFMFAGYTVSTGYEVNAWQDWYKVALAAGAATVTLGNMPTDAAGDIELYDSLGSSVKREYSGTKGSTVVLKHTATAAGDYYIKVMPWSSLQCKGDGSVIPQYVTMPYSLTVTQ